MDLIDEFLEQPVIDRVKSCWFFSILADECRDSAGKQQLALFFRYVWFDPISSVYSVEEDFVQFLHCPRLSGEALFNLLLSYVNRNQIPMQNGRGQGYDGGSNISGKHNGLQAWVKRAYPKMPD